MQGIKEGRGSNAVSLRLSLSVLRTEYYPYGRNWRRVSVADLSFLEALCEQHKRRAELRGRRHASLIASLLWQLHDG